MRKKKRQPKYSVGTIVRHISAGKYGRVISAWHDGEGFRYEVRHSGWVWSIPEWALAKKNCSLSKPRA